MNSGGGMNSVNILSNGSQSKGGGGACANSQRQQQQSQSQPPQPPLPPPQQPPPQQPPQPPFFSSPPPVMGFYPQAVGCWPMGWPTAPPPPPPPPHSHPHSSHAHRGGGRGGGGGVRPGGFYGRGGGGHRGGGPPPNGYQQRGQGGCYPMQMHPAMFDQSAMHFQRQPYMKKQWGGRPQFGSVEDGTSGIGSVKRPKEEGEDDDSSIAGDECGGDGGGGPGGKKRRKMGGLQQTPSTRTWNREDAERALALEMEYQKKQSDKSLIIRFPDPELSREIVRKFHPAIDTVHFQSPSCSRYCFIQLSDDADVNEVITTINKTEFGTSHLKAERKVLKDEEMTTPESIDPYTLYVGNLPSAITTNVIKQQFPEASRTDIGYAKKMKYTRYAFVKFKTVDEAMAAFKKASNLTISSRSIILRFRRNKGTVAPPGEKPMKLTAEEKAAKVEKDKGDKAKVKVEKKSVKVKSEEKEKEKEEDDSKAGVATGVGGDEEEEDGAAAAAAKSEDEAEEDDDEEEEEEEDDDDDDDDDDEEDGGDEEEEEDDDDDADNDLVNANEDDDSDVADDDDYQPHLEDDDDDKNGPAYDFSSFSGSFFKLDGHIDNLNFNH